MDAGRAANLKPGAWGGACTSTKHANTGCRKDFFEKNSRWHDLCRVALRENQGSEGPAVGPGDSGGRLRAHMCDKMAHVRQVVSNVRHYVSPQALLQDLFTPVPPRPNPPARVSISYKALVLHMLLMKRVFQQPGNPGNPGNPQKSHSWIDANPPSLPRHAKARQGGPWPRPPLGLGSRPGGFFGRNKTRDAEKTAHFSRHQERFFVFITM